MAEILSKDAPKTEGEMKRETRVSFSRLRESKRTKERKKSHLQFGLITPIYWRRIISKRKGEKGGLEEGRTYIQSDV